MQVSDAKDFLVRQTAEQAMLDGITLSDLEKRMMYFTESGDAREDPMQLNAEFEAECDADSYEDKISTLLHRAYARVRKEGSQSARTWYESIRLLRKGDHYLVVLWDQQSSMARPPHDSLRLLGTALALIAALLGLIGLLDHYGVHWNSGPMTRTSMPQWLQWFLRALLAAAFSYSVLLPLLWKKRFVQMNQWLLGVFGAGPKR